jgi:predicted nuclease of restriction endonuclease-like RecB superfamily
MLRSEHSIVAYQSGRAIPDRLTRSRHGHYLIHAQQMLDAYRAGIGHTRRELHRAVEAIIAQEPDCDTRRIAAFCKLLDERAKFDKDSRGRAAELRLRVFTLSAKYHPLVTQPQRVFERAEHEVKALIAKEIGRPWPDIADALYADVIDFQTMRVFQGYGDAEALLARYNVAQLQASLYRAESMSVTATGDFKTILRYAKLARLLHEIRRLEPDQYRFDFSGPATVLHQSRRYGVNFARFIPALLACRGWTMHASLRTPWGTRARLTVSSDDGLKSQLPAPDEFDSSVEETFATSFGAEREGWRLHREAAVLHQGQVTFVPDFVLRHVDGREAFLEIVGFWTPEYLEAKRQTLRRFRERRIVLAVAQRILRGKDESPQGVIVYRNKIDPEEVVRALG